ncbi:MAG: ACP S-malonyltransferase [Chitinophagaceae bacterium]|jgi:[acyl-carrier-protein] S-malonyltransferase|nr:ACP S-malonyltransferase [Chitinophagaceae bacterium]
MNRAYLFPGQGFQYVGMGKTVYDSSPLARDYFEAANDLLGYRITDIMFHGPDEKLFETQVVQNAIFLVSLISALKEGNDYKPSMVAGHSLGETTALVANGCLSFEDGLMLMNERAVEMENAFRKVPAAMVAVLGLEDRVVERVCDSIEDIVVPANYNCPGQLVIAGTKSGVDEACRALTKEGARRFVPLQVGGAVHSPLMQPVVDYLEKKLATIKFNEPKCPIYPNVTGVATINTDEIRENLTLQQIKSLRWTTTIQNMLMDGATEFVDCGPPHVISGMVRRISKQILINSAVTM